MTAFKEGTSIFDAEGARAVVALDRTDKPGGRLWVHDPASYRRDKRREVRDAWLECNDDNADLIDFIDSVDPVTDPYWKERVRNTDRHQALRGYRRLVFAARSGESVPRWRPDLAVAIGLSAHRLDEEIGFDDLHTFLASDRQIDDTPSRWPVVTLRGSTGEIEVQPPERPRTALDVLREIKPILRTLDDLGAGEAFRRVNAYLVELDREEGTDD